MVKNLFQSLEKYTQKIVKEEFGFDIKVRQKKMPMTNRDAVFGQCYRDAPIKRICYNNCILSISEFGEDKIGWCEIDWFEIMVHEITHLIKLKYSFEAHTDKEWKELLKDGEFLDGEHTLSFWKSLRILREKYSKYKSNFLKEIR